MVSNMKRRLVLVTGGAGFIGSYVVEKLLYEGYHVRVIDNFSTGNINNLRHLKDNFNLEIIKGDLKNYEDVKESLKDVKVVFHYAANPEVRISTVNPRLHFEENVVATFNLLEAMRELGVKELVFASSSSVYGEVGISAADENALPRPVSVYGASKASCECLIHSYTKLYGIRAVVLRYANVVGPRLRHGVIYDLLMKLKEDKKRLVILGDGTQVRSFVYIYDAVEATLLVYRKAVKRYEVYNVASDDWVTVNDVVNIIREELKLSDLKVVYKPTLHGVGWLGDVKRVVLNITKLKSLGFRPKYNSRDAVRLTVRALSKELGLA